MLNFLNKIFNHSSISTFFSGIGTTFIQAIISKFHKSKTPNIKNDPQPQYIKQEPSLLQNDILTIKKSIQTDLTYKQEETFTRYFNKYKNKLNSKDVDMLNEQSSSFLPNYNILLSKLLGLIEAIEE